MQAKWEFAWQTNVALEPFIGSGAKTSIIWYSNLAMEQNPYIWVTLPLKPPFVGKLPVPHFTTRHTCHSSLLASSVGRIHDCWIYVLNFLQQKIGFIVWTGICLQGMQ